MQTNTRLFLSAALLPLATALYAADAAPAQPQVSAYLSAPPGVVTKVTIAAKETYDSNIYLLSSPNTTNQPGKSSLITAVTPAITTDYKISPQMLINLSYIADINVYHADSTESYTRHTGGIKLTEKEGDYSYMITGGALINDGSKTAPTYAYLVPSVSPTVLQNQSPAIGGGERWGRRAYDVWSGSGNFAYTSEHFLIRPVVAGRSQVFHTDKVNAVGYQNFENRGEYSYGVDVGFRNAPDLTTYVSYRQGHQWQDNYFGVTNNYANDLTRLLIGTEGNLWSWCKANILFGTDQRTFSTAATALSVDDKKKTMFWSNSSVTLTPFKEDTITLSYVRFLQPASTGRNAYDDLNAEIQWRHTLTKEITVGAGYRIWEGSYLQGGRRDELDYSNVTVAYKLNAASSVALDYQHVSTEDKVAGGNPALYGLRYFTRNLFAVSYKLSI